MFFVQILVGLASMLTTFFEEAARLSFVVLGGLVLWTCVVIARYILNGSTFRSRGRRR